MNKEIISKLLPAAMIDSADGIEDSFKKMSVNIDRVLRSDFACSERVVDATVDKPDIISIYEEEDRTRPDKVIVGEGEKLLEGSLRHEKPYITVPRIV
ncbi:MAG: hypothetical protein IKV39_02505 [Clostridia bacterium]|nr:hypothetical protein [Clostridia bacterium]